MNLPVSAVHVQASAQHSPYVNGAPARQVNEAPDASQIQQSVTHDSSSTTYAIGPPLHRAAATLASTNGIDVSAYVVLPS
jgi:hypothetical protein